MVIEILAFGTAIATSGKIIYTKFVDKSMSEGQRSSEMIKELMGRVKELEQTCKDLQKDFNNFRETAAVQLEKAKDENNSLKLDVMKRDNQIDNLKEELQELTTERDEIIIERDRLKIELKDELASISAYILGQRDKENGNK